MAKGPSPLRAKMAAFRARPYTDAQRLAYVPCECEPRFAPSPARLDREADLKLSGGFKTGKNNICPKCFTARSVNGTCGC